MYLEITPITFDVKVKEGKSLSQLRFFLGDPKNVEIHGREVFESLLRDNNKKDATLSVSLEPANIGGLETIAFEARKNDEPKNNGLEPIKLWKIDDDQKPDPCDYWKCIPPNKENRLNMKPDCFYILRSKEKIALTKGIAVYCRAIDETLGEMRIHYAGFAHPLFGRSRDDDKVGTPLIFEVRAHNVKVNLRDGEKLAHLIFYRMSEDVLEEKESLVGAEKSGYEDQDLKLSGYFGKWPEKLKRDEKYLVQEAEEE